MSAWTPTSSYRRLPRPRHQPTTQEHREMLRVLHHRLMGPEGEPQSSGGTESPQSQSDKGHESPQEKQTPETKGPKTAEEAVEAALGPAASDDVAAAALDGKPSAPAEKPAADKPADDKGDKGKKGDDTLTDEQKAAKAAAVNKDTEDAEKSRIEEEDRKAAAGDKDAIAA